MGIDIYLKWHGQTVSDEKIQAMGYSTEAGHLGYLREAYHGAPYATKELMPEAFNAKSGSAKIPAARLSARLPGVLKTAAIRNQRLYHGDQQDKVLESFKAFVALAELKEQETGKPCTIVASY